MMPKYVSVNDDNADLRSVKSYTSDLTEVPLDETSTDRRHGEGLVRRPGYVFSSHHSG